MKNRRELAALNRKELIQYGKENGISFPEKTTTSIMRDDLYDVELPKHSDTGVMKIARKIKHEADLGRGTSGVVDFLKTIYPTIEHEEARQKARAM